MSQSIVRWMLVFGGLELLACSGKSSEPSGPTPAREPTAVPPAPSAAAAPAQPNAPPGAAAPTDPAAAPPATGDAEEACARVVVVAYKGAEPPAKGVTRDKARAEIEAREMLEKLKSGSHFGTLARGHSDAPTSGAREGYLGTFKRSEWPAMHAAVRDAVYGMAVGALADAPIEAPYGYVVLQRCPIEKARSRHILIRYKGAERAPDSITRTKDEAKALATQVLAELRDGADFAELAKAKSEDGSAERGGDVGLLARGQLAPAYDTKLFSLPPGGQSQVVETAMGFHIIQRLE
ncbi:MAG TPA: peptidylprolyl isomerase [Polyangiaceae bacterium]|nr:peptidylprolyl isomerase [Polyangiaceae bacterium]